jgi:hypothetical protein
MDKSAALFYFGGSAEPTKTPAVTPETGGTSQFGRKAVDRPGPAAY